MSPDNQLNSFGQMLLGSITALSSTSTAHPICTIKNRLMVGERALANQGLRGLYSGLLAINITDMGTTSLLYLVNSQVRDGNQNTLYSSALSGAITSPICAIGEGAMTLRQVKTLPYRECLRRSLKISGIAITMIRDIPYSVGMFWLSDIIKDNLPIQNEASKALTAGLLSGMFVGSLTTSADKVKTLIQGKGLTFCQAWRVTYKDFLSPYGRVRFLRDAGNRSFYIGTVMAVIQLGNHYFPKYFPEWMR